MKTAANHIGRFLLGLLLKFIGIILLPIVSLAATIHYLATLKKRRKNIGEILTENGEQSKQIGVGYDILGNIVGGEFFNWLFLKKKSQFPFGIAGEKMSTVLELNFKLDNLNEWGLNLRHDLNTLEFDHCEKSLEFDINKALNFIEKYKKIQAKFETMERTKEFERKYKTR
jgi:hypothetical protein